MPSGSGSYDIAPGVTPVGIKLQAPSSIQGHGPSPAASTTVWPARLQQPVSRQAAAGKVWAVAWPIASSSSKQRGRLQGPSERTLRAPWGGGEDAGEPGARCEPGRSSSSSRSSSTPASPPARHRPSPPASVRGGGVGAEGAEGALGGMRWDGMRGRREAASGQQHTLEG
ncbi:hypothetical protein BS50DRAFT_642954 [Corynespora cassiicola Philippines]|uniref:Uncharacterized protein n=1 Tax=Corynespora cassiicola Philippines TaxID=1448308 RepID=A0A2T2PAA0_CORCC|nr:hypothetical protein BS50DRAFT_642954 [Corynespora cassiicola Philippines]